MITGQVIFLILVLTGIYYVYPKAEVDVNKDWVQFKSINANVIMISENPDFSDPRYIDLTERKNMSLNLVPGTYYWKSENGFISGWKNEFTIDSEVGIKINRSENESGLVNLGNVKINVTKNSDGMMVGRVILEPDSSEKIEDKNETYIGRQE